MAGDEFYTSNDSRGERTSNHFGKAAWPACSSSTRSTCARMPVVSGLIAILLFVKLRKSYFSDGI